MTDTKITIVLLPGLNGTQGLFQPLVDNAPDHFNLIAIDYPTHENYSYELLVDYVLPKISHLQGGFMLLGESFSGPLALFVAQTKPQGLMGVILVASFATSPNLKLARLLPWTLGFWLSKPLYTLRLLFSGKKNISLIYAASRELQKVAPSVLADRIQSIFNLHAETALINCHVPIVYFRGKKDFIVPEKNLRYIVSIRTDIQVVEFNTSHFLLQSAPVQAWAAIAGFAERLARPN